MLGNVEPPAEQSHAAFFDLDKTVIAKSSTLALSRPFFAGGLINRRAMVRSAYAQLLYLLGGADHERMLKARDQLSKLVVGWDVQTVRGIVADALHHVVQPLVYDEAVDLIDAHHLAGRDVILISSAGQEVAEPIGELLGVDRVIATRMGVRDGRFTGEVEYYAYGANKADAIRELAAAVGYDPAECYAYSDSATDLPMLEAVGHPCAVNPDRALRRIATERGWPIEEFAKPVALRRRSALTVSRGALAAAAVGAGAAAAGMVWAATRRQDRRVRPTRVRVAPPPRMK